MINTIHTIIYILNLLHYGNRYQQQLFCTRLRDMYAQRQSYCGQHVIQFSLMELGVEPQLHASEVV